MADKLKTGLTDICCFCRTQIVYHEAGHFDPVIGRSQTREEHYAIVEEIKNSLPDPEQGDNEDYLKYKERRRQVIAARGEIIEQRSAEISSGWYHFTKKGDPNTFERRCHPLEGDSKTNATPKNYCMEYKNVGGACGARAREHDESGRGYCGVHWKAVREHRELTAARRQEASVTEWAWYEMEQLALVLDDFGLDHVLEGSSYNKRYSPPTGKVIVDLRQLVALLRKEYETVAVDQA